MASFPFAINEPGFKALFCGFGKISDFESEAKCFCLLYKSFVVSDKNDREKNKGNRIIFVNHMTSSRDYET